MLKDITASSPLVPRRDIDICFVHSLPLELLCRIFEIGSVDVETERGSEDEGEHSVFTRELVPFQILVSHVCSHWRSAAVSTPSLWTTIPVSRGAQPPFERASALLQRSQSLPIDVHIHRDVDEYKDDERLENVRSLFSMFVPRIHRWRTMELSVSDYRHMQSFLSAISCPSIAGAPQLTTLELSYFGCGNHEDFTTTTPQIPTLFGGSVPLLTKLVLSGVHVDWHQPWITTARNIEELELAYHPETVRPSWAQFSSILRGTPAIKKLVLRQSGPSGDPGEWFIEPTDESSADLNAPIELLHVTDFVLTHHSQTYAIALLRKVYLPALKNLGLEFRAGDYTNFIRELARPATSPAPTQEQSPSLLSRLESFTIWGLPCQTRSIRTLYGELRNLASLDLSLSWNLPVLFLDVLCSPSEASGGCEDVWMPQLVTLRASMVSACIVRKLIEKRRDAGAPLDSIHVEKLYDVKEGDVEWLRKNVRKFEVLKLL